MDVQKYEMDSGDTPKPENYAQEVELVNALLDLCRDSNIEVCREYLASVRHITPWVALQLGCMAESMAEGESIAEALTVAALSVDAALRSRSANRIYANMLTLAGVFLRLQRFEEAEKIYYDILTLPMSGGINERASAHVTLGDILRAKGLHRDAAYHYERGLFYPQNSTPFEARKLTIEKLAHLYRELSDFAGLAFCVSQLRLGDAAKILREKLKPDVHVEDSLALVTRLHSLGEHELADIVFQICGPKKPHNINDKEKG